MATAEETLKGLRFGDSDQLTGSYMALAVLDLLINAGYLQRPILDTDRGILRAVGGLDATAYDTLTVRNEFGLFVTDLARGGQWFESADYNLGTPQLAYLGARAIQILTGRDCFPELTAFRKLHARFLMNEVTNDLRDSHQWGDEEHPHDLAWHARDDLYMMVAELLETADNEPTLAAAMRGFYADVMHENLHTFTPGGSPLYARTFYFAHPAAPVASTAAWQQVAGTLFVTPGTGHVYGRSNWDKWGRSWHLHSTRWDKIAVDHMMPIATDLRVHQDGKWVLNHPLLYIPDAWYHNQTVLERWGGSSEYGEIVASAQLAGEMTYAAATNAGAPSLWAFLMPVDISENTRSVFDPQTSDLLLLIIDRVHATDPRDRPGWEAAFLYPTNVDGLKAMPAMQDQRWHTPIPPVVETTPLGKVMKWTDGGQPVQLLQFMPPFFFQEVIDEKLVPFSGYISDTEKKTCISQQLPLSPGASFNLQVSILSAGQPMQVVKLPTTGAAVIAIQLGLPTKTVSIVASAQVGPVLEAIDDGTGHNKHDAALRRQQVRDGRLIKEPFTVSLPTAGRVFCADLDPALAWEANGGGIIQVDDLYYFDAAAGVVEIKALGAAPIPLPEPEPEPVPIPLPTPPETTPPAAVHPRVTITSWSTAVFQTRGVVNFELFVPEGRQAVEVAVTLRNPGGTDTITTIKGTDLSDVSAMLLPKVGPGTYLLFVKITDSLGSVDQSVKRREVTVS
jgi:hypothetical protein